MPEPKKDEPVKESATVEVKRAKLAALLEVAKAAKVLEAGWHQSGFYDRQDPAEALALHDALDALA